MNILNLLISLRDSISSDSRLKLLTWPPVFVMICNTTMAKSQTWENLLIVLLEISNGFLSAHQCGAKVSTRQKWLRNYMHTKYVDINIISYVVILRLGQFSSIVAGQMLVVFSWRVWLEMTIPKHHSLPEQVLPGTHFCQTPCSYQHCPTVSNSLLPIC